MQRSTQAVPLGTDLSQYKYIEWRHSDARRILIGVRVHTMVYTWRSIGLTSTGEPTSLSAEELALPPFMVSAEDNVTVGKSLLRVWEERVAGAPMPQFMETLAKLGVNLVFINFAADSHSANCSLVNPLSSLLTSVENSAFAGTVPCPRLVVWPHHEKCNLHQLGRVQTTLVTRCSLNKAMKGLGSVLRQTSTLSVYKEELRAQWRIAFAPNTRPRLTTGQKALAKHQKALLVKLLNRRCCATHYELLPEGPSEGPNAIGAVQAANLIDPSLTTVELATRQFVEFCNNSFPGGEPDRYEPGLDAAGIETATKEGCVMLMTSLFHGNGFNAKWEDTKFLKQLKTVQFWGRLLLLSPVPKRALLRMKVNLREVAGAKLSRGREWLSDPQLESRLIIALGLICHLENLFVFLFNMSDATVTKFRSLRYRQSLDASADFSAYLRGLDDTVCVSHLMEAVEIHIAELWELVRPQGPSQDVMSKGFLEFFEVAKHFWPSSHSDTVLLDLVHSSVMAVVSELWHRFIYKHAYLPYSVLGHRGQLPTAAKVDSLMDSEECCSRACEPLRRYAAAVASGLPGIGASVQCPREQTAIALRMFDRQCRVASLSEEIFHSWHRAVSHTDRRPRTIAYASCRHIKRVVTSQWARRGGRDLTAAGTRQSASFKRATSAFVKHRRLNHQGNFGIAYISAKMTLEEPQLLLLLLLLLLQVSLSNLEAGYFRFAFTAHIYTSRSSTQHSATCPLGIAQ